MFTDAIWDGHTWMLLWLSNEVQVLIHDRRRRVYCAYVTLLVEEGTIRRARSLEKKVVPAMHLQHHNNYNESAACSNTTLTQFFVLALDSDFASSRVCIDAEEYSLS